MNAVYAIPALPLLTCLVLLCFGRRLPSRAAGVIGTLGVGGAFAAACLTWLALLMRDFRFRSHHFHVLDWIQVDTLQIKASFLVDPLSMIMVLFVTGVSTLIHVYSIGYMKGDRRYAQFFMYMNLFVFSMVVLVLADSLPLLFLGWEGVGVCSYFLVGFWFEKPNAATAAKKAFVVNRIGDVGLLLGMFLLFVAVGTLDFTNEAGTGALEQVRYLSSGTATAIALLLFVGAVGKSAQLPLFVWLPDAMEGPTPVSALIHAATMVTAGVYLMARFSPLLLVSHDAALIVAIVGAVSAIFAATVACAQHDIKRVLAYSTMSQLGYMFLAVGAGSYIAGVFHMVTHAFFKALLFMAAGSAIHALASQQDLRYMGGLRRVIPFTFGLFLIGWLAIIGVPPFSGFWSKDLILASAWEFNKALWAVGVITALLTAYYMTRMFLLAFFGTQRHNEKHVHESPKSMLIPMLVLGVAAALGGGLEVNIGPSSHIIEHFLRPPDTQHRAIAASTEHLLALVTTGIVLLGVVLAVLIFRLQKSGNWPGVLEPRFLQRAWFADAINESLLAKPGEKIANWMGRVLDTRVVDGMVNGSASGIGLIGSGLRRAQSGQVRAYALLISVATVLLLVWVAIRSGQ